MLMKENVLATEGQMDELRTSVTRSFNKLRGRLTSDVAQGWIGNSSALDLLMAGLLPPIDKKKEMVVRHYKIDRTKTVHQMMKELNRIESLKSGVLETMPTDGPDEGEIYFFNLGRPIWKNHLALEFTKRGLVPHYLAQMQVNIDDQSFADGYPNLMQWGEKSSAAFRGWATGRSFSVWQETDNNSGIRFSEDEFWDSFYWYAGVRK